MCLIIVCSRSGLGFICKLCNNIHLESVAPTMLIFFVYGVYHPFSYLLFHVHFHTENLNAIFLVLVSKKEKREDWAKGL